MVLVRVFLVNIAGLSFLCSRINISIYEGTLPLVLTGTRPLVVLMPPLRSLLVSLGRAVGEGVGADVGECVGEFVGASVTTTAASSSGSSGQEH